MTPGDILYHHVHKAADIKVTPGQRKVMGRDNLTSCVAVATTLYLFSGVWARPDKSQTIYVHVRLLITAR